MLPSEKNYEIEKQRQGQGSPSEQNNATPGSLSLPGLTGQSSRIVNYSLNNPMDHPVKPDDDLIASNFLIAHNFLIRPL
jgi:hypothetical protein